jgi:TetR/AcrR family transcriptional regulator, transcriptional repressor of aconitase
LHQRRFEQLPAKRQREILRIAAQEFAKHGFQGTSYNRLLERAGVGKSSAYYYFEDKQDLFLTVVAHCYEEFFKVLQQLPPPTSAGEFWQYVEQLNLHGLEFMQQEPIAAAVMQAFSLERSQLDLLRSPKLLATLEGSYVELIQAGQALGAVRTDLPLELMLGASTALSAACDQWFIEHAKDAGPAELKRLAGSFAELSRRLLQPWPAAEAARKPQTATKRRRGSRARRDDA